MGSAYKIYVYHDNVYEIIKDIVIEASDEKEAEKIYREEHKIPKTTKIIAKLAPM